MDGNRFDNLVRTLAVPRSRRAAFKAVVGLTAGALLGARSGVTGAAARKVGVCHRTGSSRNLYQFLIVDENAVDAHRAHGDAVGVDLQTDLANCGSCGVVCPISTNPCLAAACQNGACGFVPANEGGACNDGNACTQVDTCRAGVCIGSNPVLCTALEQCHVAGVCDPGTGICSNPAKPDGASCDDSNACTQTDTCQGGACIGSNPVVCTPLDQCHDVGICNPATGLCSNPNRSDGTLCNDNNACTSGDTCQGGVCTGGDVVVCPANGCQTAGCDPVAGCFTMSKPLGASCSDNNVCNGDETCDGFGNCQAGSSVIICPPCLKCNPTSGICEPDASQVGASCPGDGNRCFGGHQCNAAGACVGVQPKVCTALDQCHDTGTCNPSTGLCSNPDKPNGTTCVDPNLCKQGTACFDGVCTARQEVTCPDQRDNPCRGESGQCNPQTGSCEYSASPAGQNCSTPLLYPCTNSTCDGAGTCNRGGDICDSECQFCGQSENACFDIPPEAHVECEGGLGFCGDGTCNSPCEGACQTQKDACYEVLDPGGEFTGDYLCCAGHLDANGNCCWLNNGFGQVVDGVCRPPSLPECCPNDCPELCSVNTIRRLG